MKVCKRKCRHCHQWFTPDPRNAWHQVYCSCPDCQKASRAASQRKWRRNNSDYFHGTEHRQRVREWRSHHPLYWRKSPLTPAPIKDLLSPQPPVRQVHAASLTPPFPRNARPLQDLVMSDHFVLVGLAAMQAERSHCA